LEGIDFLHSQKILHLDLKLLNILLNFDDTPIIIDFGSAREITNLEEILLSESFNLITPNYCANELFSG
jgi:serine/threonine protein kinase